MKAAMNKNFSTLLILLACAARALADSTIGSVSLGLQSPAPVMPGSNATYTVTVIRAGSGNVDVYLTATNLPAGVSATFVPSLVHLSGSRSTGTATLTLATTAGVTPSAYSFTVTGRDGGSFNIKTAAGVLVVGSGANIIQSQPATLSLQKLSQGSTQITCTGSPGYSYQIQATTDLANPFWTTIGTAIADQAGHCAIVDPNAGLYSQRFYRTLTIN